MQKHNRKQHRKPTIGISANTKLSESCTAAIRDLTRFLDGQESFASEYLRSEFLSKYCSEDLVPGSERRKSAISKWYATEGKNADTNRRLRGLDRGYNILPRVAFYPFLKFAQRLISDLLGPLTNELVIGKFSGGASTSRRRSSSNPAQKFTGQADVTEGAMAYVDVIHHEVPLFRQYNIFYSLREVEGAILFTVPKKTDIDRCACKEPDINMFLQKGVGAHIRRRLRRFGINLNDQSINRRLAHLGSLDGSLATLDLSAASDSMSISCVEALLPRDWFLYLNDIRSQSVIVDGTVVRTEMFSSMGNGFTFELESLIFWALMRTTAYFQGSRGVVSVYGDDIIIPSGMYDDATWVLSVFGFTPNPEKSFHEGSFRESCGGHYHAGEDVTPFYLKRKATHLTDVIRVANQLRLWTLSDPFRRYEIPSAYLAWKELKSHIPSKLWGGYDYSSDSQLVSPDVPRSRLVRVVDRKRLPVVGSYAQWHSSNWNRTVEPELGFQPVETTTRCKYKEAIPGAPTCSDYFYEELIGDAGLG